MYIKAGTEGKRATFMLKFRWLRLWSGFIKSKKRFGRYFEIVLK